MNYQEKLLQAIRSKIADESINENIAAVLNISYDAAHRRVSAKSKFSIEETVLLCKHFKLSMDTIFAGKNQVVVEKTKEVLSFDDLENYFKQSADYLKQYLKNSDNILYYSAKDIPLFYTIDGGLLSKFKLYVWLNLLLGNNNQEAFEQFYLPKSLQQYTETLKNVYDNAMVSEIWNDTTINSTLQQISYYFESGLLSHKNAMLLLEELRNILKSVEVKSAENKKFHLYYNELLILNNNVYVANKNAKTLFVPYTMLGYFITEDKNTCQNAANYFVDQLKNSKSLNLSGTKDRKQFFNKAYQKIDFYLQKIDRNFIMDF